MTDPGEGNVRLTKSEILRDRSRKPPTLRVNPEGVPAELRGRHQWLLWRWEWDEDTWTKSPFRALKPDVYASTTRPETWSPFNVACGAYQSGEGDGIGYVFASDDPYGGIDLDNSFGDGGELTPWASPILARFDGAYVEVSPSGTGLKMWVRGKFEGKGGKHKLPDGGAIEIYCRARYFAVTGRVWEGGS